jgi:hypothetical protein
MSTTPKDIKDLSDAIRSADNGSDIALAIYGAVQKHSEKYITKEELRYELLIIKSDIDSKIKTLVIGGLSSLF